MYKNTTSSRFQSHVVNDFRKPRLTIPHGLVVRGIGQATFECGASPRCGSSSGSSSAPRPWTSRTQKNQPTLVGSEPPFHRSTFPQAKNVDLPPGDATNGIAALAIAVRLWPMPGAAVSTRPSEGAATAVPPARCAAPLGDATADDGLQRGPMAPHARDRDDDCD